MSAMARRVLFGIFIAGILAFAFLAIPPHAQAQDVKQYLRDQYQGKIFVLRGFQANDVLRYDSSGEAENANTGDWTADGFVQVNDIRLSDDRLIIKGQRMAVGWLEKGKFELHPLERPKSNDKGKEPVTVKIDCDPGMHNPSIEQIDAIIAKIFLTTQDSLPDLVPSYWKPCVRNGLKGTDEKCVFAPEIRAIPGIMASGDGNNSVASGSGAEVNAGGEQLFKVGKGVSPPRQISRRNPEFSERARAAKYQGTVTLLLTVSKEGAPTNIRISQPVGYGLDAKAVEAVQTWRFAPAEKDGQPVSVIVAVEVDFHLY